MNRVVVSIAPPHAWLNRIPASCGKRLDELAREPLERLRPRVVGGGHAVAPVVDGVVAAPQDPVVDRASEVVELVAGVRHALAPRPADRRQLVRRQRLGHQRVVVDGHEQRGQAAHPGAVGGRRDQHDRRLDHPAPGRRHGDAGRPAPQRRDGRPFGDPGPATLGRGREAPGELGRVEHHGAIAAAADPGEPERRVDRGLDGVAIEVLERRPVTGRELHPRLELLDLPGSGRDVQHPGRLEIAVDALVAHEGDQLGQVPDPLLLEHVDLAREVEQPVAEAMGQRGGAEAPVPSAGAPSDPFGLEHDDPQRRIGVEQLDRRPQAGEPGADDRHVGDLAAGQRRPNGPGSPVENQ